jgi:hypothetical protein
MLPNDLIKTYSAVHMLMNLLDMLKMTGKIIGFKGNDGWWGNAKFVHNASLAA